MTILLAVLLAAWAWGAGAAPSAGFGSTNVLGRYALRETVLSLPAHPGYASNFSGCCVDPDTGRIAAVMRGPTTNDYAVQFYTPDGELSRFVALTGFEDIEGICPIDAASNLYAVVEERINEITILAIGDAATNLPKSAGRTIEMGLGDLDNSGIEGIAWDAARRCFYAVKEYYPEKVYKVTDTTPPVVTELFSATLISGLCADLSDLWYDSRTERLLILSDESHLIVECTLSGAIRGTLSVPALTQPEGVALSPLRDELYLIGEPNEYGRYAAHWSVVTEGQTTALSLNLSEPPGAGVTASVRVVSAVAPGLRLDFNPEDAVARFTNGLSTSVGVRSRTDSTLNPPRHLRLSLADPAGAELGDDTVALWRVVDPGTLACALDTLPGVRAPFRTTVTALNTNDTVLTGFGGQVFLRLWADTVLTKLMLNRSASQRTTLFQASTRGLRFSVASSIVVTHLRYSFGNQAGLWTDSGTLLGSASGTLASGGWVEVALPAPVTLTAGNTYRVAASRPGTLNSYYTAALTLPAAFADGTILSGCLTNAASTFPRGTSTSTFGVDIKYQGAGRGTRTLAPSTSGAFEAGSWSGWLTVTEQLHNAEIEADDGQGHTGRSARFDVISRPSIALQVPPAAAENAGTLTNAGWVFLSAPTNALDVSLFSDDTGAIRLPARVAMPQSATSNVFDVTVVDNGSCFDTHAVPVYATAAGYTAGTNRITVQDDDRPRGLLLRVSP